MLRRVALAVALKATRCSSDRDVNRMVIRCSPSHQDMIVCRLMAKHYIGADAGGQHSFGLVEYSWSFAISLSMYKYI
jgi:hypothetical protein